MATESNDVVTQLLQQQLAKHLNVAALSVFLFDYCLTFSSEVHHVWGRKWETTRIVFTISRYLPFIASAMTCYNVLYSHKCGAYIFILDALYDCCIISAEVILILRTYALWGRNRWVLAILAVLAVAFIAAAIGSATTIDFSLPGDSDSPYSFYPSSCAYRTSRSAAFQYIFLMVYEIILQSMNTWRKFRTYRNVQSQTLHTLYWDGIMYMFWVILLSAVNMAVMVTAPLASIASMDTAQVAIHGLLASRIFFNLRDCDERIHHARTESSDMTLVPLHYRSHGSTSQSPAEGSGS
ncbi:hypothetical protein PAXINDRAFT_171778 [Paxillus involutus ATCC 200175]|uniref:DUF6533 domain-containing protein n=1 Tax=Paxillus involutus ATCC 200175 TaxID=664439 RepID=A0A0C9TUL5_PAXIN|nr:hypothetical protein PAXINDRAFT_171778 [Paxillus involutus ATCC 200175]